jgi:Xaa-Pro aminopeptidase
MTNGQVELVSLSLPKYGLPRNQPEVSQSEYANRIELARARAGVAGLDYLLVYGDREHFANLAYLTTYDPRFEEALLIIPTAGGRPTLILGNEGLGYSELIPVEIERKIYQGFSLLGQPRHISPRLDVVLRECDIRPGSRVGLAGWKYATAAESDDPDHWLDAPAFIVDMLRALTGNAKLVVNSTAIFMSPVDGLRSTNSVEQLAAFEFAAAHCSQAVRDAIEHLQPGMTELEAVQNMRLNGLPLSVHLMFSTGPRARLGLPSPTSRVIQRGDPFLVAFGLRGGLTARGGFVIASQSELPAEIADYLERLVKPYFAAVVAWYEHVGIGVSGGELQAVVEDALAGRDIGIALNPGHLIHLDEWVHSPIYPRSEERLRSGMLVQCDIIPVVEPKYHTTNAEDTIALADQSLREQLATAYPEAWQRIQARRTFMQDVLNIKLKPEVLPFSNTAAMLQPFALDPSLVLVAAG